MEVSQRLARLDPELVDECAPSLLVGVQRLGLASATVEGEDQLRAQPLAQRILLDEPLQLAGQLVVPTGFEVLIDALLETCESRVLQPGDLRPGKAARTELRQRFPAPERERVARLALLSEPLKTGQVELALFHPQQVARLPGRDPLLAEHLPEPRDVHLERLLRGLRRSVLPQAVGQPVGRDDAVRVEEEHRQERALLRPAEIEEPAL